MKVLHLITGLGTGGAELMLYKLLAATDQQRVQPSVMSLRPGGPVQERIEALGVPVYSLGMRRGVPTLGALWSLARGIGLVRPALIHGWMYHGNLAALVGTAMGHHVPVIWGIHHAINDVTMRRGLTPHVIRAGARLSANADLRRIAYVSRASAAQHEALGYMAAKTVIIPNGFDCDEFRPDPDARASLRKTLQLPADALLIGLIARYHPVKDHANFLRAAAALKADHPEAHFVLAGREIAPANTELVALVDALGLGDRVHLLGERQDVPRILAGLDILTSSSISEAFPLTVGEAMACGVPCVVTDVGDSSWAIGDTGIAVPARDSSSLAAAWHSLLAAGPEARREIGYRARERVMDHFSLDSVVNQYQTMYEETRCAKQEP